MYMCDEYVLKGLFKGLKLYALSLILLVFKYIYLIPEVTFELCLSYLN